MLTEPKDKLREKWVSVRGVLTYTLCQGSKKEDNAVLIIIPGNPGVAQYYAAFVDKLYRRCRLPIRCISHAGHVTVPEQASRCFVTQNDYLSLDGQIQHKLAYIFDYIPADKNLILIGHSIGCYMILEMLSAGTKYSLAQSGNKVKKCYLLFPTIERLAQSPKGQFFTPLLKYFRWIVPLFTLPVLFLPHKVKQFLIGRYFGLGQVPQCVVEATIKLLSPTACRNCLYLANIEMQSVCELDSETIGKHLERLCFYYGANDAWCPTEYHDSMKRLFLSGEIYLCSNGIQHAFVLNSSDHMAVIVSDWIESI